MKNDQKEKQFSLHWESVSVCRHKKINEFAYFLNGQLLQTLIYLIIYTIRVYIYIYIYLYTHTRTHTNSSLSLRMWLIYWGSRGKHARWIKLNNPQHSSLSKQSQISKFCTKLDNTDQMSTETPDRPIPRCQGPVL